MILGAFKGKEKRPTVVLEVVASQSLRIWHSFVGTISEPIYLLGHVGSVYYHFLSIGMASSNNDLNVLACSPLFDSVRDGTQPQVQYQIGAKSFNTPYRYKYNIIWRRGLTYTLCTT